MIDTKQFSRMGFMQGRLCDLVDGKIQAFPWNDWQKEFPLAQSLSLQLMEWTLDHHRLYENPLMTPTGQQEILALCGEYGVTVPSLTGDLFMQAPFYKACGLSQANLVKDLHAVLNACSVIGIKYVCVPLVDGGRLEDSAQEDVLIHEMKNITPFLLKQAMAVVFELDYAPRDQARFLTRLDPACFGINLDTGNSAAFGFNHVEELSLYGGRIFNVHIKDRLPNGGTTVPLGQGVAKIAATIRALEESGYTGNYILQTARADDGDHAGVLKQYAQFVCAHLR